MNALHADGLGSVRAVTDATGAVVERTTYRPFGEEVRLSQPLTLAETKGFIGERYDDGSGLQYLNARYYDPRLGMFVQPDWWEVTRPGVGTNRYSYSFNDPVNGRDPGGHYTDDEIHEQVTRPAKVELDANRDALADVNDKIDALRGIESLTRKQRRELEFLEHQREAIEGNIAELRTIAGFSVAEAVTYNQLQAAEAFLTIVASRGIRGAAARRAGIKLPSLAERVKAIHSKLDPIAAQNRTTAVLSTSSGTRIVASGARDLSPAQREALASGEVVGKLKGAHAEVTAITKAKELGLAPKEIATSRTICEGCRVEIERSGGIVTGPNSAYWP